VAVSRARPALRTAATATVWASEVAKTRQITDGLGKTIDRGIEDTVTALRLMGFQTSGSCEGHVDWGCATPWVDVDAPMALRYGPEYAGLPRHDPKRKAVADAATVGLEQTRQAVESLLTDFYSNRQVAPAFRLRTVPMVDSPDDDHFNPLPIGFRIECAGSNEFDGYGRIGRIRPMGAARREMKAFTDFLIERHLAPALEATAALTVPNGGSGPSLADG
jgi:hypothetical protein